MQSSAGPPLGESHAEGSREGRPAFYAARAGGWRDWWTLLHPPYTAWHLAYVVIGACLAPTVNLTRLVATLLAFFFAVGLAAHSLDELNGRPLGNPHPGRGARRRHRGGSGRSGRSRYRRRVPCRLGPDPVLGAGAPARRRLQLRAVWRSDPQRCGLRPGVGVLPGTGRLRGPDRSSGGQSGDRRGRRPSRFRPRSAN